MYAHSYLSNKTMSGTATCGLQTLLFDTSNTGDERSLLSSVGDAGTKDGALEFEDTADYQFISRLKQEFTNCHLTSIGSIGMNNN